MTQAGRRSVLRRIGALLVLAAVFPVGRAAAGNDLAWSSAPSLGLARSDLAAMGSALGESRIYAAGGLDGAGNGSRFAEQLDPGADAWQRLPDLLEARPGATAQPFVSYSGTAESYVQFPAVYGGCCDFFSPKTSAEGIPRGAWLSFDPPMPNGHSYAGSANVRGPGFDTYTYIIGGGIFNGVINTVDRVEAPGLMPWRTMSPMPTARSHLAAATLGNRIYAVGGRDALGNALATVEVYDPSTDRWSTGRPLPEPRDGLGLAVVDGQLYAVGGRNAGGVVRWTDVFDVTLNAWYRVSGPKISRYDFGLVASEGSLWAIGGRDAAGHVLASVEAGTPFDDTTPPAITPVIDGLLGNDGWYRSDVTVSWSVTDRESPESIDLLDCRPGVTLTVDTDDSNYGCMASSHGGLALRNVTIKRDATPPSLTASATTSDGTYLAGTHTTQPVKVTFACTDAMSGVAAPPAPVVVGPSDRDEEAIGECTDVAGNTTRLAFGPVFVDTVPALAGLQPAFVHPSGGDFILAAKGGHLTNQTELRWNGVPLVTTLVGENELRANVPKAMLDLSGDLALVRITAAKPSGLVSNAVPLTLGADVVSTARSALVAGATTATVSTAPATPGAAGVTAALAAADGDATLTAATYLANPTPAKTLDASGGFVDLRVGGVASGATVEASFYYPSTLTGAAEDALELLYFDGTAWRPVRSSGGAAPAKSTADDPDGTVSGGRYAATFDATSKPAVTALTGTVLAVADRDRTKPTIVAQAFADGQAYDSGTWTAAPVAVEFDCTDGGSGVATVTGKQIIDVEGRRIPVEGICVDSAGNQAHAIAYVSIDRTAPTCTATASPDVLRPASRKFVTVKTTVSLDDLLSGPSGFTLVAATTTEGDAASSIRNFDVGSRDTAGSLLADRAAGGPGRVYALVYEAADRAGNRSRCTAKVVVPADAAP